MNVTNLITRNQLIDAEDQAHWSSRLEDLFARCRITGKQLGSQNLPRPVGDSMKTRFESFFYEYQAMIDEFNAKAQAQVVCFAVVENDAKADQKIAEMETNLQDAERELASASAALKATPSPGAVSALIKARAFILVILLFDTALNSKYYQMLGYGYLESLIIGGVFAAIVLIFTRFVPKIISFGKSRLQRRMIAASIFLLMTAIYAYLAFLRTEFATATGTSASGRWLFLLLSLFAFCTAVAVYVFAMPTKAEKDAVKKYKQLLNREHSASSAVRLIAAETQAAKIAKSNFRVESSSLIVDGCMMEKRIITEARRSYAAFREEALRHRTDGLIPDCISDDFPFEFVRNFDQIN